jgi:hypothetical protein
MSLDAVAIDAGHDGLADAATLVDAGEMDMSASHHRLGSRRHAAFYAAGFDRDARLRQERRLG